MAKKKQRNVIKTKGVLFGIVALIIFTATAGQIDLNQFDPNNLESIANIFKFNPEKPLNYASLEVLPDYDGKYAVVELNQNVPEFTLNDLSTEKGYWQTFTNLDALNRVGQANALLHKDFMPTEDRESISNVYPSGWKQKKMKNGNMIYNRSHLIGHQFTGENANWKNLMTGTEYFNQVEMKDIEQQIAAHLRETNHYVRYRVTPYFKDQELTARGVQMEVQCVEDEEVTYNVFLYNVQEGYIIDYATGQVTEAK